MDNSGAQRFAGKHVFVTGGGSGIGLACARAFAAGGAYVSIFGRSQEKLDAAIASLSQDASEDKLASYSGDVGVEDSLARAIDQANDRAPVNIVVANAGIGGLSPLAVTTDDEWQGIMQTNLSGTFYTFKHGARLLARAGGGAMCAISSIAGVRTHRFMAPYCVSKAGIDMLVRNTADELGVAGIRVNSVCPGLVDTEIAAGLFATDAVHEDYMNCMPLRRTGKVDDIAASVAFLCSDEASWVTGVSLSVDGGHHLRRGPDVEPFARMGFGDDIAEGKL